MKKALIVIVLCTVFVMGQMIAYAGSIGDWTNLPGYQVDGEIVPAEIKMTDKGLQVYSPKGYYSDDGKFSGVILNEQVDVNNFSVEFTIDKVAGFSPEVDTWISVNLLNKKEYFRVSDAKKAQGIVSLLYPMEDGVNIFTIQHVLAFAVNGNQIFERKPLGTYKIEIKKNKDGTFDYMYNGKKMDAIFDAYDGVYPNDKAYFSMGASTSNGQPIQFTILKINGKPVSDAAASENKTSNNPQTGDAGMIPIVAITAVSGVSALLAFRKRKI